jgi:hypothetical protein
VFLGNEDEPDAKYVQLEDCGHVFEFSDLDRWMDRIVLASFMVKLGSPLVISIVNLCFRISSPSILFFTSSIS